MQRSLREQLSQVLEQNRLGSDNARACPIQFLEFDILLLQGCVASWEAKVYLSMSKLDPVNLNAPGNIKCAHRIGKPK